MKWKMAISRTKIIGTSVTLTLTSVLLWIAFNQSFILTASGDITCSGTPFYDNSFKSNISDCQAFWNVTSINYTYYFRNKNGIELEFSPEVNGYEMYVKDGRYKSGWRLLDKSGNFTYRKGIKYQFMAFIFKEINQTIKWSITAADVTIDPILFGIQIDKIQDCVTETKEVTMPIYGDGTHYRRVALLCETNVSYIYFNNKTNEQETRQRIENFTCGTGLEEYKVSGDVIDNYIDLVNTSVCKDIGFQIGNRKIEYDKINAKCTRDGCVIQCDYFQGGNRNGICDSGENCYKRNICTNSVISRTDVPSLDVIKVE